jgi:type IV pilus assembly protein PilE
MQRNTQNGFSLVELLVVVAIVGILVKIAYPSYQESVLKSKRADAKASLSQLANWMERYYTANGYYTSTATSTTAPTLPIVCSPQSSTNNLTNPLTCTASANYTLAVSAVTNNSFTVTATPTANKVDPCGALTLDSTGLKSIASAGSVTVTGTGTSATAGGSYTANYCWTGGQ